VSSSLDRISVVLVETLQPGNIGSAARAMSNMGLSRLKLVNPRGVFSSDCLMMAGKAAEIVTGAHIYTTLQEALAEEAVAFATTSSRDRLARQAIYTPREAAPLIRDYSAAHEVALVFGSEKRGLSEENLALCQYVVTIPAHPGYPVLNLAQAVMILAYEVYVAGDVNLNPPLDLATHEAREEMFRQMERTLLDIGFLNETNPGHIMRSIRRFLGRADLTPRDIQILRGILSQMDWYAAQGRKLPPDKVRKP
jgi:tRNA/rRNA methyltransferase